MIGLIYAQMPPLTTKDKSCSVCPKYKNTNNSSEAMELFVFLYMSAFGWRKRYGIDVPLITNQQIVLKSASSRQAKESLLALVFWLNEIVPVYKS